MKSWKLNLLKKITALVGVFIFLFALTTNIVSAQSYDFAENSGLNTTGKALGYDLETTTPDVIIGRVIFIILGLLGIVFLGLMIYAGITWMTAQGNEQRVEKSKTMITEAIIGLVIVVIAYGLTYFIINYFSGKVIN